MTGIVSTFAVIGRCIPQQRVLIKRIQSVTDIVVLGIRNGVSRRSDSTVSVNFCITAQSICDIFISGIEL